MAMHIISHFYSNLRESVKWHFLSLGVLLIFWVSRLQQRALLSAAILLSFPNKGGSDLQKENVLRSEETDTMTSENIA
jgi:hypothetical protein